MQVKGKLIDHQTRCIHYHSEPDVIAIKFKCCNEFYPCYECHEETAGHKAQRWERSSWNEKAILCGRCEYVMTINEYLNSHYQCPSCKGLFNPKCANHNHLYFDMK